MDRTLLRYFIKLYETGNITRAAEDLLLSRQSLSGYIARLEREVGAQLFTRSREGVKLTEAGCLLRDFAERDEARFHESELDFNQTLSRIKAVEMCGKVSFALPVNMLSRQTVEIIAKAGDGSNGYVLEMVDAAQPSWRDVKSGRFDVVMSRRLPPKGESGVASSLLIAQKACLLVNKTSSLAALEEIDFQKDLYKKTCLCMFDYLMDELGLYARKQKMTLQKVSPNLVIIESLMSRQVEAVCILPEITARYLAGEQDKSVFVPLVNFPISLDAYLVHRENPSLPVRRFLADMEFAYKEASDRLFG